MNDKELIHEQYKKVLVEADEELGYNNNMKKMELTKEDKAKIANVKKFEEQLQKLLDKFPDVRIYGNMDGDVKCHTTLGSGFSSRGYVGDKQF